MKNRKELIPVLFLGSGAALTVCGLAIMVAYGAKAPIAALALLLVGLLDGVTGLIWTIVLLFSRRDEEPGDSGSAEARGGAGRERRGGRSFSRADSWPSSSWGPFWRSSSICT